MKMIRDHFDTLKAEIDDILATHTKAIDQYESGNFKNAAACKDLDKRFRWDLFWHTASGRDYKRFDYLNDSHIDTALRRIVPALTRRF